MAKELSSLTVTAALAQMCQQQLLPSQLLGSCCTRIEQREPRVQAWTHVAIAAARQQAAAQDQQLHDHPLASILAQHPLFGIPVGVKDIFATVDMPTAWGMSLYRDRYLTTEATVVTRLKAAGAIILGKTADYC